MSRSAADFLADMLNGQLEAEKTAEEQTEQVDVAEQLAGELNLSEAEIEAAEKALDEGEKKAEAEKQASEAELLGRFMARGFVDEMKKLGGSLEMGGGSAVAQQADASTPQDGSKVLAKIKAKVESAHNMPVPPGTTMGVVRKILSTAKKPKAPVTAVETNG